MNTVQCTGGKKLKQYTVYLLEGIVNQPQSEKSSSAIHCIPI